MANSFNRTYHSDEVINAGFEELLKDMDTRFEGLQKDMDARFEAIDARSEAINARVKAFKRRFNFIQYIRTGITNLSFLIAFLR